MKVSIVIIGDEILLGRVQDTNSGLIARSLSDIGFEVKSVRTVGDKSEDIRAAIEASVAESDLTISTGGLGPTRDDITKPVLAEIFGGELVEDHASTANILRIFAERGLAMNALTQRQALVPSSCRVIVNRFGTAPIMWFERAWHVMVAMPGVPFETRGMLPDVCSCVKEYFGNQRLVRHAEYTVCGISESSLAESLASYEDALPDGCKLAYLPGSGEIVLRIDGVPGMADETFDALCASLESSVGDKLAGHGRAGVPEQLLHRLRKHSYHLASAESCTGGNIAHMVTAIAGCSDVFNGSVVSYANEVKTNVLGVDSKDIERYGAVSEPVVRQMVEGVARLCGAECAVATSGIAGPGGGSEDKPVGTVWIAVRTPDGIRTELCHFRGDREAIIARASTKALIMLLECV